MQIRNQPLPENVHIDANLAERLDTSSPFLKMFDIVLSAPAPLSSLEDIENRLSPVLLGLARQNRLGFLRKYVDSISEHLKVAIKQV